MVSPHAPRSDSEPDRVRRSTTRFQLRRIDREIEDNVRYYASQPPEVIAERIADLQHEWSVERYLQVNVAVVAGGTALLALTRDRRWGYVTCGALGFFLYHALAGFDPPLPPLRQLGIRTRSELNREIYALKLLRGDFNQMPASAEASPEDAADAALRAVGL